MDIIENSNYITNIDVTPLCNFCKNLSEDDWKEFTFRQKQLPHQASTRTIGAIYPDRDNFPEIRKITFKHKDVMMDLFSPAIDAFTKFYDKKFEVTAAIIVLLPPETSIGLHTDTHPYFGYTHRIHICIDGDYNNMDFIIRKMKVDMKLGDVIEINNRLPHEVIYRGKTPRLNAVIDLLEKNVIGEKIYIV